MELKKKNIHKFFYALFFFLFVGLLINIILIKIEKNEAKAKEPITINLLTSVHQACLGRLKH